MKKIKLLALSGSTRKQSSNGSILLYIKNNYADLIDLEIFDGIDKLPHFNPDLDNENLPESVQLFRNKIEQAAGILICTPEYVFSLPGSLKNAIEWNVSTTLFSNKPLAFIVAAASGEKAFESLDLIMNTLECTIPENCKLLIKGGKGKVNENGELKDQMTENQIDSLIHSLIKIT